MSSTIFSSDLTPDPAARRVVIGTGVIAVIGGFAAIAGLSIGARWQVMLAAGWLLLGGRDLWLILQGFRHCTRIRVDPAGQLTVFAPDRCCAAATISNGSVVLRHLAWLRFRTSDGRQHAELLRRKSAQSEDWRRLQVIWRHLGAGG